MGTLPDHGDDEDAEAVAVHGMLISPTKAEEASSSTERLTVQVLPKFGFFPFLCVFCHSISLPLCLSLGLIPACSARNGKAVCFAIARKLLIRV